MRRRGEPVVPRPWGIACALAVLLTVASAGAGLPSPGGGVLAHARPGYAVGTGPSAPAGTSRPTGGYGAPGCGDPALSVPLVTSMTGTGLVRWQAGIVVSAVGHVLTQWSSVKDAQRIIVTLPGQAPIPAHPLGSTDARDLVLLALSAPAHACPAAFGDVSGVGVSQTVRVYGYPLAGSLRPEFVIGETGRITAIQGPPVLAFRSDMVVAPGFGGGPVVDEHGKVIGIQRITAPGVLRAGWSDSARGLPALVDQLRRRPPASDSMRSVIPPSSIEPRLPRDRQIKIAVHVSLSGPSAAIGRSILDGAAQAIAEYGAAFQAHGLRLLLVPLDDRGDPKTAVANAREHLLDDPSVLLVVGHNKSGACLDAARVYERAMLPMITPACEVATFTDEGLRTVFRVIGRDDVQGAVAAQFARGTLHARTAYVAYEPDNNYGLRTAAAFWWEGKHLGLRVTGLMPVDADTLGIIGAAVAAAKPDVVYFGGGASGAGQFLKALRSRDTRAAFLGPDGLDSSEFAYFAGPAAAGTVYTMLDGPIGFYHDAGAFSERFHTRAGRAPGPFATLAYDATRVGLEAIARSTMDYRRLPARGGVLAALHDPAFSVHGVTGMIRFSPNGDRLDSPVFVMRVRGPAWDRWPDNMLLATITP